MALATHLDVLNAACALISVEPLQSMSDELPGGQAAQLLYDQTVDFCLGMAPWSFARQTKLLNRVEGETSMLGFAYIHVLPSGRIGPPDRLLSSLASGSGPVQAYDYDEEGRVHSDEQVLYAQFTARVVPSRWHPAFRMAVIHALAATMAEPLTGNGTLAQAMAERAFGTPSEAFRGGLMRAALSADARNTPARALPASSNPLLVAWSSGG
jgi:hypothetical protein